jgi:hypothetical protein
VEKLRKPLEKMDSAFLGIRARNARFVKDDAGKNLTLSKKIKAGGRGGIWVR